MAQSSILGADRAPSQAPGRDVESLGPSDTSDSGSDVQGEIELATPEDLDRPLFGVPHPGLDSASDSGGTGERSSTLAEEPSRDADDILPDQVRSLADEAAEADDLSLEADLELGELTGEDPALDDDEPDEDALDPDAA